MRDILCWIFIVGALPAMYFLVTRSQEIPTPKNSSDHYKEPSAQAHQAKPTLAAATISQSPGKTTRLVVLAVIILTAVRRSQA
jgi:hypothetical protein